MACARKLSSLYELETGFCFGAIRCHFSDVLGGGKFYKIRMKG